MNISKDYKKGKIITIHPVYNLEKGYFNRDLGQIGFTLSKKLNLLSEVWCLNRKTEKGFEIEGQKWKGFTRYGLMANLRKEANNISILHLYHIRYRSLIFSIIYKMKNEKGKIFVKLDCPFEKKNDIMFIFTRPLLLLVDKIGVENKNFVAYLQKIYRSYKDKFIYTPSGAININNYDLDKKNEISIMGRMGAPLKNYELLLTMLSNFDLSFMKNRKINLIGEMTPQFKLSLEKIIKEKPELEKIISVKGFLYDKKDIYDILSQSKIFLHTSNYEGEPNVQYDAMFCGCYMVTTEVGNIKDNYPENDILIYEKANVEDLKRKLQESMIFTVGKSQQYFQSIKDHCINNFVREKVLSPLYTLLDD